MMTLYSEKKMKKIIFVSIAVLLGFNAYAKDENRIAVLDFQTNGAPRFIGSAVADIVTTEMQQDKSFQLLERTQIDKILKERSFQKPTSVDSAVEFGQVLAVDRVILGSVSLIGDSYTLSAKIVEVKSGAIEYADSESCSDINDIESAAKYLSIKLLNRIAKQYHDLPARNYQSKKGSESNEVSLIGRYGVIWGFKTPQIINPSSYAGQVKFSYKEQNLTVYETLVGINFNIIKGLSARGLLKYSNTTGVDSSKFLLENKSSTPNSASYEQSISCNSKFQGLGFGIGLHYEFKYTRLVPFIGTSIYMTRYWFKDQYKADYSYTESCTSPTGYDRQTYHLSFAQNSLVLSTELDMGFKIFITENFGILVGAAVNIPFYGNQFSKFKIEKTASDTDNNLIPEQNRDLENEFKYNTIQPPAYYVQLGVVYKL
jgi:hypothetical protein